MTTEASQQPVIDFLSDPANHGGAPVKRIDTHAASVFLAGERALKIKRAVRFPFLDFSTLAKRKAACEAEIAVNRAFAPSIYRGVVPITREPNGRLAIGGKGEPVEWAVEMRRFDESQTLDNLAETGRNRRGARGCARARCGGGAPSGADGRGRAFRRDARRNYCAERGRARIRTGFIFAAGAARPRRRNA